MARRWPWEKCSNKELLEWRLCDLDLQLEGSGLEEPIERLYGEIAARSLRLRPHCWLSEEWFSPTGIPGIAIPFYLAHPRLKRLERSQSLEVEGGTAAECLRLLRHEAGHALVAWLGGKGGVSDYLLLSGVESRGFDVVLALRLGLVPANVISLGVSLTPIGWRAFTMATFVGSIPLAYFWAYVTVTSASVRALTDLSNPGSLIAALLFAATIGLIVLHWRRVTRRGQVAEE